MFSRGIFLGGQVDLSVQHLVNCVSQGDPIKFPESMNRSEGCDGGSSYGAFAMAHETGMVDSSCLPCKRCDTTVDKLTPALVLPTATATIQGG